MKALLASLIVLALAAPASAASYTPSVKALDQLRYQTMNLKERSCQHTWTIGHALSPELRSWQLRWKWNYWQGVLARTVEKGDKCR